MFPLDGKIQVAEYQECIKMEEKKWFPLARRSVATSRNKVILQKIGSPGFHKQNKNLK